MVSYIFDLLHFKILIVVLRNSSSSETGGSTEFGSPHHRCHMRDTHFTLAVHRAGNVADYTSQLEVSVRVQMFNMTRSPAHSISKGWVNVDIGEPRIIQTLYIRRMCPWVSTDV